MKYLPVSRNLTAAVLVLFLAVASAPAAVALPAGPGGTGGPAWDVQAFFGWMQGLLGEFFDGGVEEESGPGHVTAKIRGELDPNGNDVTASSAANPTEESTTLQDGVLGR